MHSGGFCTLNNRLIFILIKIAYFKSNEPPYTKAQRSERKVGASNFR